VRHLFYTNYESGNSGLSNGIMSIEVGVALAHLTNRFLLLDGNVSPPANVVAYDDRVDRENPSRVTDLIDLPVAWGDAALVDLDGVASLDLTEHDLADTVFCFPPTLDRASLDAQSFARGRTEWVTIEGALDSVPVLRLAENGSTAGAPKHRSNLCFYSYLFYLDDETRRGLHQVLRRMQPKSPFRELAQRVARDLGDFNAVHLRRGDFKVTYGVTTLDRQPFEAVEALEDHFSHSKPLVIVTDERNDPFFDEITAAYPQHVFIDHHILDAYESEFAELPQRDGIALAYLSQLVAAESQDFIGTMTSTFTSIIQRYRGLRGADERFKFLWNELPEEGDAVERGSHPASECVPLDRGVMVDEFAGPYSWNRVSQRLNPAWMREWPESFETTSGAGVSHVAAAPVAAMSSRSAGPTGSRGSRGSGSRPQTGTRVAVSFEGFQVSLTVPDIALAARIADEFNCGEQTAAQFQNVIGRVEIKPFGRERFRIFVGDVAIDGWFDEDELLGALKREFVPIFARTTHAHTWLRGAAFSRAGRTLVVARDIGDSGYADDSLVDALQSESWDLVSEGVVPIHVANLTVTPFGIDSSAKDAPLSSALSALPLESLVVASFRLHAEDQVTRLSPSLAVAELIPASLNFSLDRSRAVKHLCSLVEKREPVRLVFSSGAGGARLLSSLDEVAIT
jgi:hypothetical protein